MKKTEAQDARQRKRDDVPILALCAIAGGYDVNGLYRKVNQESINGQQS